MPTEYKAFVPTNLFEIGMGNVTVIRKKSPQKVEAGIFLVDAFCLGIKDAFYITDDEDAIYEAIRSQAEAADYKEHSGAFGRKLIEDAVAYAKNLGFAPHRDYKKAAKVFGGIDTSNEETSFEFGCDGMPCFIKGPNDSSEMVKRVLVRLEHACGPNGFLFEDIEEMGREVAVRASESGVGDDFSSEAKAFIREKESDEALMGEGDEEQIEHDPRDGNSLADYFLKLATTLKESIDEDSPSGPASLEFALNIVHRVTLFAGLEKEEREKTLKTVPDNFREFLEAFDDEDGGFREVFMSILKPDFETENVFVDYKLINEQGDPRLALVYIEYFDPIEE